MTIMKNISTIITCTHFKYINTIANNTYIFLRIKLTTHNSICGYMPKYENI